MENVQLYVYIIFELVTFLTIYLFYKASSNNKYLLLGIIVWISLQGVLAFSGFYLESYSFPPRFALIAAPAIITIIISFINKKSLAFFDTFNNSILTLLHTIRIPVELVLYWLFLGGAVPELMTFEGRNFDILAGITAPIMYYFVIHKKVLSNRILLIWNFLSLILLLNIIINGTLSVPTAIQQFAFDQPNIALINFPFVWLPCCIVPIVILSHLISIRQLLKK